MQANRVFIGGVVTMLDRAVALMLLPALAAGWALAYIDSRPTWDDTGLTAAALLACSALLGAVEPRRPWLWALAIGVWLPLVEIAGSHNAGSLIGLVLAFIGAYLGAALRKTAAAEA